MPNILYLLNHKTLTDFEVPILIKKGYYCYIPKNYSTLSNINSINHSTINFYDNFLDISIQNLQKLNEIDWFSNNRLSNEIIEILINNFSCIFLTLLTGNNMMTQLLSCFKNKIYFRFFGLESNFSYTSRIIEKYGDIFESAKFIFSYQEIINFESTISKKFINNSFYVPLGISNSLYSKIVNTCNSIINKPIIAFVCSRTDENGYYNDIYKNFITNFKEFNFIIYGKNNEKIKDLKFVKNNLGDDEYYKELSNCKCMFYHGIEPRHLHYHPIEAIIIGLPVIFYENSLLSTYLSKSPGKCKNIIEVKYKITKILNNDIEFISSILKIQDEVKKTFMINNNINVFNNLFSLNKL